jgi:hypothetical protein
MSVRQRLLALNTNGVAVTGLSLGFGSLLVGVIASVKSFFAILSSPPELQALYIASKTHHDPSGAVASLVGASIAVVGSFTMLFIASLLLAYFGRPATVPDVPQAAPAGNAGS